MVLDADGAQCRHRRQDRQAARHDGDAAAQAILEIAVTKMSLAVREVSVEKGYDPRDFVLVASGGAGPLHVLRHRARAAHPDGDRAAVPVAFLGARHAARRRAPRFHPHLLRRSRRHRLRRSDEGARRDGRGGADRTAPCAQGAVRQIHLDLRYVGQEFTLPVPVTLDAIEEGRSAAASAPRSIALYEQRYAHHSPDEPVEMVNIRLAAIGKRPKLTFPRKRAGESGPARRRPVYLGDAGKPVSCPVYARDALAAGARIKGPALIEEHGTTTRALPGDRLPGGAVRRTDHCRRTRTMSRKPHVNKTKAGKPRGAPAPRSAFARPGDAGSDPQRAAGDRQRDGRRPAAHLLQHDDLRGARLLHRAGRSQGRADLAERRRRVALRRRSRRHHHRRHEALRRERLRAGRRDHHQSSGGRRPAPQQHRHLHAVLLPRRAFDVRHGARALDRRRRHVDRLRRRSRRSPIRGSRACSSTSSKSTQGRARRDALSRHQGQHPLSGILARRHEIADGGLPARGAPDGRAVRQIRPRHDLRGDRAHFRRDRAQVPQRRGAAPGRRLRSLSLDRRRRRAQRRAGADPRQGHGRRLVA